MRSKGTIAFVLAITATTVAGLFVLLNRPPDAAETVATQQEQPTAENPMARFDCGDDSKRPTSFEDSYDYEATDATTARGSYDSPRAAADRAFTNVGDVRAGPNRGANHEEYDVFAEGKLVGAITVKPETLGGYTLIAARGCIANAKQL